MMTRTYLGFLGALTLVLSGCGEAFQGKFVSDTASVSGSGACFSGVSGTGYTAVLNVQISGNDISFSMDELYRASSPQAQISQFLVYNRAAASLSGVQFAVTDYLPTADQGYKTTAFGNINANRDEITNFQYTIERPTDAGTTCKLTVTAPSLVLRR